MDKTYNCFTADNDIFKVPWNVWRSTLSSGFGTVMARGADDDDNYDDNLFMMVIMVMAMIMFIAMVIVIIW